MADVEVIPRTVVEPPVIHFFARIAEQRCEREILDNSAVKDFRKCPRFYFYRHVMGRSPKDEPPYFRFGSAYHRFREILEKKSSVAEGIASAVKLFRARGGDPVVGSQYEFLTELRLIKSCSVAFARWEKEKKIGAIEVISTEQIFNVELRDGSRRGGRADQLTRWVGKLWGRDFKTTTKMGKYYERSIYPNDQFGGYTFAESKLAGEPVQGQIVEVLYNTKTQGPEISQFLSTWTESQLEDWENEQLYWHHQIEISRANDFWPKNDNACFNCKFHSVCKASTENMAMGRLENDYVYKPWRFEDTDDGED